MKKLFTKQKICKGLAGLVGVGILGSLLSCSPRFEERDLNLNTTSFVCEERDNELQKENEKRKKLNDEFKKLDILIGNYLPVLGERGLRLVGLQGGYCVIKPKDRFEFDESEKGAEFVADKKGADFIPYYFNGVNYLMPEKSFIEDELSDWVSKRLWLMLENKTKFDSDNSSIYARTLIEGEKVLFNFDVCLDLSDGSEEKKDKITYFKKTSFSRVSYLGRILGVARYISDSQKFGFSEFPVNNLEELAREKGLSIDVNDVEGLNLTSLVEIKGGDMDFRFLIKYFRDDEREKLQDYLESFKKEKKPFDYNFDYKKELGQSRVFGV